MNNKVEGGQGHPISVGLPVYNGENHIQKCIDSILAQTHQNFELIISDNASTDSTPEICREYYKKDSRIKYFRQEKNLGLIENFNFVLLQARNDYFKWAAADDFLEPDFLEKNLQMLSNNNNAVFSMSKIKLYGKKKIEQKSDRINYAFKNFREKFAQKLKPRGIYRISGNYEEKVNFFLNKSMTWVIFGVHRTDALRKSIIKNSFVCADYAIILNLLKYGDLEVVNEPLVNIFDEGTSKKGIIHHSKLNKNIHGRIFPYWPFTSWFVKNLGLRLFFRNFDRILVLNVWGCCEQVIDLSRILLIKLFKK